MQHLVDENFNVPQKIDLLLGAKCFFDLLKLGQICYSSQDVILKETVFGYIISGVVHNSSSDSNYCGLIMISDNVGDTMKKFWEVENISDPIFLRRVIL